MVPLKKLLKHMMETDASDIYLTVGLPPMFRTEGIVDRFTGGAEVLHLKTHRKWRTAS